MRLERDQCSVLPLVLKSKWYNMIACGEKHEEYRTSQKIVRMIQRWWGESRIEKKTAVVEFRCGYTSDAPRMAWKVHGVYYRQAGEFINLFHGEPDDKAHYVISLAERVEFMQEGDKE